MTFILTIFNKTDFDIEDFEEEIVLVNFQTGVYYTIKGVGPTILRAFQSGLMLSELYNVVLDRFGSERLSEVELFVNQLLDEGILTSTNVNAINQSALTDLVILEAPILEKFDDVSDLIKLDPIHDVSDLGWPHKK